MSRLNWAFLIPRFFQSALVSERIALLTGRTASCRRSAEIFVLPSPRILTLGDMLVNGKSLYQETEIRLGLTLWRLRPPASYVQRATLSAFSKGPQTQELPDIRLLLLNAPGFRVSRCSPGMTSCYEWRVRVEDFVSEQPFDELRINSTKDLSEKRFFGVPPQNDSHHRPC